MTDIKVWETEDPDLIVWGTHDTDTAYFYARRYYLTEMRVEVFDWAPVGEVILDGPAVRLWADPERIDPDGDDWDHDAVSGFEHEGWVPFTVVRL